MVISQELVLVILKVCFTLSDSVTSQAKDTAGRTSGAVKEASE